MSLRDQCIEAGAQELSTWMPGDDPQLMAGLVLDALLDTLTLHADEWRDVQKDYPQLYEVAPSKREHMVALGILSSEVPHRRVTTAVVTNLVAALRSETP